MKASDGRKEDVSRRDKFSFFIFFFITWKGGEGGLQLATGATHKLRIFI